MKCFVCRLILFCVFFVGSTTLASSETSSKGKVRFSCQVTHESCQAKGYVDVVIKEGQSPYKVKVKSLSDVGTTTQSSILTAFKIDNKLPGRYNITIEDANGGIQSQEFVIQPYIVSYVTDASTCFGNKDRTIVSNITSSLPGNIRIFSYSVTPEQELFSQSFATKGLIGTTVPVEKRLLIHVTQGGCESKQFMTIPACTANAPLRSNVSLEPLDVQIYPNPTKGDINFTNVSGKFKKVDVYNSLGERVLQFETNDDQLNISQLTKGMYFLIVIVDGKQFSHKIQKVE